MTGLLFQNLLGGLLYQNLLQRRVEECGYIAGRVRLYSRKSAVIWPEECGYIDEEHGYMPEECGYIDEERGYMPEECGYMCQ